MTTVPKISIFVALLMAGAATSALAAGEYPEPRRRALAAWAARADGHRMLARKISSLKVDGDKRIGDFYAQDARLEIALRVFVRSAQVVGRPRHYGDGTCEVDIEIPIANTVARLKQLSKAFKMEKDLKPADLDHMKALRKEAQIRVTGEGEAPDGLPEEAVARITGAEAGAMPAAWRVGWKSVTAEGQLSTRWAATSDAHDRMLRRIEAISIKADETIGGFVAGNDRMGARLQRFVRGIRGETRYMPDQVCQVDVECDVAKIIALLKKLAKAYRSDKVYTDEDFEQIATLRREDVLKVTGLAIPSARHIHEALKSPAAPVPPWARQTVRATGSALPPVDVDPADTRVITARMARTDALANLERLVNATKIDAKETVGDFVAALPESRTDLETFLSGARAVRTRHLDDGRCEVTVELFMARLHRIITFFKNKEPTGSGK